MSGLIRIPLHFYADHVGRDLPAPPVMDRTRTNGWIDPEHPDAAELLADAEYYADPNGPEEPHGIKIAALALIRAMHGGH